MALLPFQEWPKHVLDIAHPCSYTPSVLACVPFSSRTYTCTTCSNAPHCALYSPKTRCPGSGCRALQLILPYPCLRRACNCGGPCPLAHAIDSIAGRPVSLPPCSGAVLRHEHISVDLKAVIGTKVLYHRFPVHRIIDPSTSENAGLSWFTGSGPTCIADFPACQPSLGSSSRLPGTARFTAIAINSTAASVTVFKHEG